MGQLYIILRNKGLKKQATGKERIAHCVVAVFFLISGVFGLQETSASTARDSLLIEDLTETLREQFRLRQLDSALVLVDSIRSIALEAGMTHKLADCEANYGLIERARNNIDASLEHYRAAGTMYENAGDPASAARAYTAIGQIKLGMQLYQPAYQYFSRSLALREKEPDSLGMANNLVNLGGSAYFAGRLDTATDHYYRALRIADRLDNLPLKAQIMMNASNIHVKRFNYDAATRLLEDALALRRRMGDRQGESEVLMNLGIVSYEQGLLERAGTYYSESMQIKEEMGTDIEGIVKLTHNLGLIAREQGDNNRAIIHYNKALEMARQINDVQTQATILNSLGTIMMMEGNDEALPLLTQSLEISNRLQLRKLMAVNYDNLHQYHASKGNYRQAYEYFTTFQLLNDSLNNLEIAARIAELQTMYDTEIREQENLLLKEQSSVLRLRFVIVSISAVAIAFLATAFFVLFNLKRRSLLQNQALLASQTELGRVEQERYQQEQQHLKEVLVAEEEINRMQKTQLQEKSRELATAALLIIKKNELLTSIRQKATKALQGDPGKAKNCLEGLIEEADRNVDLDEQWELFKRHFEAVHTGFFVRLSREFPDLTNNELKFCAYLRINLSSKEIAQLLNISVESAITKRYRLRKKLNLQREDNLVDFLMQF